MRVAWPKVPNTSRIVAEFRAGNTMRLVFVIERRPLAGDVSLREHRKTSKHEKR
jgi:hypothetical protein